MSGQKVGDLLRRVKDNFASVSEKVVLLIGTNDLLRGTSFEAMRDDLQSLLKQLRSKGAERIILLTLPPVPRLNGNGDHWNRLSKYNEFIQQCHNGEFSLRWSFLEEKKNSIAYTIYHFGTQRKKGLGAVGSSLNCNLIALKKTQCVPWETNRFWRLIDKRERTLVYFSKPSFGLVAFS